MSNRPKTLAKVLTRLRRRTDGLVAVEYAFVMPLVMGFFLASMDIALLYVSDAALMQGVQEAARQLRTGELTTASGQTAFKTAVCAGADARIDCSDVILDVRSFTDWAAVNWPAPIYDAEGNITNYSFNPGTASSVITGTYVITTVRAGMNYKFVTPGVQYFLGRTTTSIPLTHTSVVVMEPFGS